MKYVRYNIFLLIIFAVLSGCSSSKEATEEQGEEGALVRISDDLPVVRQARVFLDGKDKGITPTQIRIDRRFNHSEILLRIGKERVRIFEIEQTRSSNSSELLYSFNAENTDGYYTEIYAEDLPKKNDSYFYIPFRADALLITDRQFGLQIIVQ